MTDDVDRNDLAYWFPLIETAGLPVPATRIVHVDPDVGPDGLYALLDGMLPEATWWRFVIQLQQACAELDGPPWFLRTGHGSGKHRWAETCHLPALTSTVLGQHASALVEWSAMAGLPCGSWAVREMIPTAPMFVCEAWCDMPVVREARVFVRDGELEAVYHYWPEAALEPGRPDHDDWRQILSRESTFDACDTETLVNLALDAGRVAGGGYWSVDLLNDDVGAWWLTDMADGDRSYHPVRDRIHPH